MSNIPEILVKDAITQAQDGGITTITTPSTITKWTQPATIVMQNVVEFSWPNAFSGCTGLTEVSFPALTTFTAPNAFSGCTGLTTVSFPELTTFTAPNAFSGCTGLTTLNLPKLETYTIADAFSGCTNIITLDVQRLLAIETAVTAKSNCGFIVNQTALTTVNADNLQTVTLYASTNGYGTTASNNGAFNRCKGLSRISFPSLTTITENVRGGGDAQKAQNNGTFRGCTALVEIDLPNVTVITVDVNNVNTGNVGNNGTFNGCTSLTTLYLPKLAQLLGRIGKNTDGAFNGCTALAKVYLPLVTEITAYHFGNCTALEEVTLGNDGTDAEGRDTTYTPTAVTSLNSNTFYGCTQSNLTITLYTEGGAALANQPWGATNATVIYEEI